MSLNNTPTANRLHIALFGRRNSGKSSLINALTGQDAALVSDIPGTTTDPVMPAMGAYHADPVAVRVALARPMCRYGLADSRKG